MGSLLSLLLLIQLSASTRLNPGQLRNEFCEAEFPSTLESTSMIAINPLFQSTHNQELSLRVENTLMRLHPERFKRIAVRAFYGIVEISGTVEFSSDKLLATRIVERIPGVTTVVENVSVQTRDRQGSGTSAPADISCKLSEVFEFGHDFLFGGHLANIRRSLRLDR